MVKSYIEAIHIVRTNSEEAKRAFVKYRKTREPKQLEDAYQTLRETVKAKPYPNLEAFKTIFKDVSARIPAAKTANRRTSSTQVFSKNWTSQVISTGCTDNR